MQKKKKEEKKRKRKEEQTSSMKYGIFTLFLMRNLRVTKPDLIPESSQRILPFLDPGIFKVSTLPFHKNWGLPFVTHEQQGDYVPFVQHSRTEKARHFS